MNKSEIYQQIQQKKSFLCVGLDTDIARIPKHLLSEKDPVFSFNKAIIDATAEFCVSYKINTAFYEARGVEGWQSMQKTLDYIPKDIFTIADAKRGDIGNTVNQYAKAFFENMDFDSITVSPYMGEDSAKPFLKHKGKWVILLALTSNQSSQDFELQHLESGQMLYEKVLETSKNWASEESMMYVVGATQAEHLKEVRKIVPNHFLLIPGVGAQGGSLEEVVKYGMTKDCGLLINSSRGIIYAGEGENFAQKAGEAAQKMQQQMATFI
jgi:orotidine-5'-phosphate decarboxylase